MEKKLTNLFLFFLGAITGLFIEIAFESPVRKIIFPDKIIIFEGQVKDELLNSVIPNIKVRVVNIGETTTNSRGDFTIDINKSQNENITLIVKDTIGIYDTIIKSYEINDYNNKITIWLSKKKFDK